MEPQTALEEETNMKAGLVSCSNGQQPDQEANIHCLEEILSEMGITAVAAEHLYAIDGVFGGTAKERAADLMAFMMSREGTLPMKCLGIWIMT